MKDKRVYNFGGSTLISNRSRVYKGGGWDDAPTTSFLEHAVTWTSVKLRVHRFRCAMDRVGTPVPFSGQ